MNWSFNKRKLIGNDFLEFLDRSGINSLTRKNASEIYRSIFKSSLDFPVLPKFSSVFYTLIITKKLHFRGNNLCIFSKAKKRMNPKELVDRNSGSSSSAPEIKRNSKKTWRRRRTPLKLAVDQHMTYNRALDDSDEDVSIDQQNEKSIPGCIKQINKHFSCTICSVKWSNKIDLDSHLKGRKHRTGLILQDLKNNRVKLMKDKNDVSLTANMEWNGTLYIHVEEGSTKQISITITNQDLQNSVQLVKCELLKQMKVVQLSDDQCLCDHKGPVSINPGEFYVIKVTAAPKVVGTYHAPLAFMFSKPGLDSFCILRFLHVKCINTVVKQLQPTKPFKHPPKVSKMNKAVAVVIKCLPAPRLENNFLEKERKLSEFPVPESLRKMANNGLKKSRKMSTNEKKSLENMRKLLEDDVRWSNYSKRISTLLHFEEIQIEVDFRKYDLVNVTMKICPENKELLLLEVPELMENRPSVLQGDWLYATIVGSSEDDDITEYGGYIHNVYLLEIALKFDKSLVDNFVPTMKFNVRFVLNRMPLQLQHRAGRLAEKLNCEKLLFPTEDTSSIGIKGRNQSPDEKLILYNKEVEDNKEQYLAVQHILSGESRPAPYLVFGPPGTGKTVTIVEAMKQVLKCIPKSHILACAPSNSAADLLVQQLMQHVSNSDIIRLNAPSRSFESIPKEILKMCNFNKAGEFYFPKKDILKEYRIIVSTLMNAGRLASARFPKNHFTHVFIDEAGNAVEAETLISVAGILDCDSKNGGLLVLAGDPKQLGPVLRSPFAIKYGLDVSLLERYMTKCAVYARKEYRNTGTVSYNNRVLTKLLQNYRSHADILYLPNTMFYENELQCCADVSLRNCLTQYDRLPRKGFPLIFHGIEGEELREDRSPSYFNPEEASIILTYTQHLISRKVDAGNIGIISPYRKQVQKIQQVLKKYHLNKIKVGTVEEFQGQERLVILISTVRSRPEYLSLNLKFKLGFLQNPKRFNVAITRAKSLLIVVGNPRIISLDPQWRCFIQFCQSQGGYTGIDFESDEEQIQDVEDRLIHLSLQ